MVDFFRQNDAAKNSAQGHTNYGPRLFGEGGILLIAGHFINFDSFVHPRLICIGRY
jgi:hypothetical protein